MEGGPEPHRPVRPQAAAERARRQAAAGELQAGHHADGRERLAAAGLASASGSSTARAACGSPTGCRTSPSCADDLARDPLVLGRRHQPLRRRLPDEHRLDPRRPAVAGRLGQLRPGHREPEPARVRRHAGQPRHRSSTARATGAPASCPPSTRARRSPSGAEPIPNLAHARRRQRRRGSAASSTCSTQLNRQHAADAAASRPSSTPASPATSWPSACRPRRPRRSTWRSETEATQASSTASTRRRPPTFGRNLPAGPPAGRARRALRAALPRRRQQVGRAHAASRRTTAELCRAIDKPVAGLLKDLKRRGLLDDTLVIWGGEFGRTPMSEKGRRPRPQPLRLHDVDGRRRRQGRPAPSARPTSSACTPSRTACTSTTCTPRSSHLLGLDHMQLVYMHKGRPERPTLNEGSACEKVING